MILITDNPIIKTIHEEILVMISKMIIIVIIPTDKQRFFYFAVLKSAYFSQYTAYNLFFTQKNQISEKLFDSLTKYRQFTHTISIPNI